MRRELLLILGSEGEVTLDDDVLIDDFGVEVEVTEGDDGTSVGSEGDEDEGPEKSCDVDADKFIFFLTTINK
jgi:hypothetical protein